MVQTVWRRCKWMEMSPFLPAVYLGVLLAALFIWSPGVSAATCGSITAPVGWDRGQTGTPVDELADCANPFAATAGHSPYTLDLDGEEVVAGATMVRPAGVATVTYDPLYRTNMATALYAFRHTAAGYEYVSLEAREMGEVDYLEAFARWFTAPEEYEQYREIYLAADKEGYFYDAAGEELVDTAGHSISERYWDAVSAAEQRFVPPLLTPLIAGTYTFVWVESDLLMSVAPVDETPSYWWRRVVSRVIPTAHAASTGGRRYTVTVTITDAAAPTGASSILFLPGIMGSRLYEESDVCVGGGEQQRWFSHTDCEQRRLFLDEQGHSLNDIYTKDTDAAVIDETVGINLYQSFIAAMNQLEDDDVIADFVPFAYDWRLQLDDLLQASRNDEGEVRYTPDIPYTEGLLYATVAAMAEASHSGQVTLVAHSNGGLVVKAFLQKLAEENDPLAAAIDNVVLIGSPQVGTPDAVTGLLHGTEIGGGWVVRAETARQLLNDAPFAYHLLPNRYYFDGNGVAVETPVVVFDEGVATAPYRIKFGDSIASAADLQTYLGSESGRFAPATDDLYTPAVGNDTLLSYAAGVGDRLADWVPPDTMHVYQLAGVGVWTPKTLRYSSGEVCAESKVAGLGCVRYEAELQHETYFTRDGDGTVVLPSALAMEERENVERWWLDMEKYNAIKFGRYVHKDMMEITEVSDFVASVAGGEEKTDFQYITATAPHYEDEHRLVYHLHSPLDMYIRSAVGEVSSTTNTIPGAYYRRTGETQYIFLPPGTPDAVLHLVGYEAGSFTLVAEEWEGDEEVWSVDYRALPSGTSTHATLRVAGDALLQVDYDGDGVVNGVVDAATDVLEVTASPSVSEPASVSAADRSGTRVRDIIPLGQVAGVSTSTEVARLAEMVRLLQEVVRLLVLVKSM